MSEENKTQKVRKQAEPTTWSYISAYSIEALGIVARGLLLGAATYAGTAMAKKMFEGKDGKGQNPNVIDMNSRRDKVA